jgi:hypothetical protein
MRKSIVIAVAVALVVTLGAGAVWANNTGQPASKATAQVGDIHIIDSAEMDWATILTQDIKTPNQKDLFIDVSLECGLYTMTHVKSKGGQKDESMAEAIITVKVLVDGEEAYPGQVVFARRAQTLKAWFQGLIEGCLTVDEFGNVIIDEECLEPEELELILDTMNANSFNFILDDLTAGVHTIEVQAMIETATEVEEGTAEAWATIGKGSVTIELVRMIKGEDILLEE